MFAQLSMRLKTHILVFFNYLISSHPYTHSQDQLSRTRKERNVASGGASWQTHTPFQAWEFKCSPWGKVLHGILSASFLFNCFHITLS